MKDPIQELRAELMAVEPSPAFSAGVRMRVERQSGMRFGGALGLTLAAVTAVAIVATVVSMWRRPAEPVPAATVAAAPHVAPVVESTPSSPALPERGPSVVRARVQAAESVPVASANTGPFLEVITNQPEIIKRIWAGIDGGVARVGLPANEFEEITVAPVRVDAIVVPKIGPPGGGGIVPGARRIVVDESARGDQR
jgi:hypothetical protein